MIMSDVGWTLWAAIQARISTIDYDFTGWAEERWARATAMLDGPGSRAGCAPSELAGQLRSSVGGDRHDGTFAMVPTTRNDRGPRPRDPVRAARPALASADRSA